MSNPPDVKISQHLQIDNGFWDALDAVVVEVERLEWGEQTHFRRDFCEAILGQICKAEEQKLTTYVHFEHTGDIHIMIFSRSGHRPLCLLSASGHRLERLINTSL